MTDHLSAALALAARCSTLRDALLAAWWQLTDGTGPDATVRTLKKGLVGVHRGVREYACVVRIEEQQALTYEQVNALLQDWVHTAEQADALIAVLELGGADAVERALQMAGVELLPTLDETAAKLYQVLTR